MSDLLIIKNNIMLVNTIITLKLKGKCLTATFYKNQTGDCDHVRFCSFSCILLFL